MPLSSTRKPRNSPHPLYAKDILLWIEFHKGFSQVRDVVLLLLALDNHVEILPHLFMFDFRIIFWQNTGILRQHSLGERASPCKCTLQASGECSVNFILFSHGNLVIPYVGVHEAERGVLDRRVNQFVSLREGKVVFRTSIVQVCEVDTHPPCSRRLTNKHHISQPFSVPTFSYETCW